MSNKAFYKQEIAHYDGQDYDIEVVRYEAPIGDQIYRLEFMIMDRNWDEDDICHLDWNIYQCVYEQDGDPYAVDESKSTGRTPMATFGIARTALKECLRYLEEDTERFGNTYHYVRAGWADERRHRVYNKVLKKMGWIDVMFWGDPYLQLTVYTEGE